MEAIVQRLVDVILAVLPSVVVFLTAYFMIRKYFERDEQRLNRAERDAHREKTLPMRLQAYERLVLFMERIHPNSIVIRIHTQGMKASALQAALLVAIRQEFEHNVTQQLYISVPVWQAVKKAKEETVKIVNLAAAKVKSDDDAIALSNAIFELMKSFSHPPTDIAISLLKEEARKLF